MNYCRIYPCLLVRQVDQFDRLGSPYYVPFRERLTFRGGTSGKRLISSPK